MEKPQELPNDVVLLKQIIEEQRARLVTHKVEIEQLRLQLAKLKRLKFGRSSERLDAQIAQLELTLEELEVSAAPVALAITVAAPPRLKPVRRPLPESLPREIITHAAACQCPECGGELRLVGEDVAEVLEYVPSRFKVIRHVRPKFACGGCQTIVQADAPSRPIARGLAGPGLLAHVLIAKYCDHQPLYRQSQIYAREGLDLDRSTLADWVGQSSALLRPLVEAVERHVLAAEKLHADDTPVPVLCPGRGTTKQGRLWTYVRDDRPANSAGPPAVWFAYSPDRKGLHPQQHLRHFRGILQADGYAGFDRLYNPADPNHPIKEAACWAHVRRKFYDIQVATDSPIANEALRRIGELYEIEKRCRGEGPATRQQLRQARAGPLLDDLNRWLKSVLAQISKKSELARAIHYALSRWVALTRYRDDGRIEIDNNAAERALRAVALGRNYRQPGIMHGSVRCDVVVVRRRPRVLTGRFPDEAAVGVHLKQRDRCCRSRA